MSSSQPAPTAGPSTTPSVPKARPYRRFLTSALHARFVHAALVSLSLSWANAAILGSKDGDIPSDLIAYEQGLTRADLLWWWFPFGPAAIKTLIYFIANLFVFFLQIATLKVGRPISPSPLATLRSFICLDTVHTVFWYLVSAWWFSEAYIWSSASMSWVTRSDNGRQDVLNEQPIYVRTFFFVLACVHACRHIYHGHSALQIPISAPPTPQTTDVRTHPVAHRYTRMKEEIAALMRRWVLGWALVFVITPFIYLLMLRHIMWRVHLSLAKPIFNLSRSNARATGIPPIYQTMKATIGAGLLLSLTWEMCSLLFVTYLAREPLKKDQPLSAASKDPNGTLLNGLKAKRDVVKTFAYWELVIIAQTNAERRKAIFVDIERPTGPMWPQMLQEGLKVLKALDERIAPPKGPPATPNDQQLPAEQLPKIVPEVKGGNIFAATPSGGTAKNLTSFVAGEMRRIGTSPEPWRPQLDKAVKMIEQSKAAELPASVTTELQQSPAALLFRSTNAARINATVLGSPSSSAAVLVDSIESITRMLIASLQEDLYGNAIKGVPSAVKQFTTSITLIEAFVNANPPGHDNISDVKTVLARLKSGLRELLAAFQMYLTDKALGIAELNAAKKASGEKTIQDQKQKEAMHLKNATRQLIQARNNEPEDPWRSFGRQPSSRETQRQLPAGDAPARLFMREEPQRQPTRTIHVPRRREMEQVR